MNQSSLEVAPSVDWVHGGNINKDMLNMWED